MSKGESDKRCWCGVVAGNHTSRIYHEFRAATPDELADMEAHEQEHAEEIKADPLYRDLTAQRESVESELQEMREQLEDAFEFIEGLPEPNAAADGLYDSIGALLARHGRHEA